MDFFARQDQARRRTRRLVVVFVLSVVCIIGALYVAGVFLTQGPVWQPELLLGVAVTVVVIVGCGSLYKMAQLSGGGAKVAEMLGGRLVDPHTRDERLRRLMNVTEEMAIAAGLPVPALYVLEEEGINAFAAGLGTSDAVIGVTRGALERLSRDELQGVIAHEFSHIVNGDMRLNVRLMGMLFGILCLALVGQVLLRLPLYVRPSGNDRNNTGMAIVMMLFVVGLCLVIVGSIGVFFARVIQAAVSRQREFLADASAVQLTRNPLGIAGALFKIGQFSSRVRNPHASEACHLFFGNGLREGWLNVFATHPPLRERIEAIVPGFRPEMLAEGRVIGAGDMGGPGREAIAVGQGAGAGAGRWAVAGGAGGWGAVGAGGAVGLGGAAVAAGVAVPPPLPGEEGVAGAEALGQGAAGPPPLPEEEVAGEDGEGQGAVPPRLPGEEGLPGMLAGVGEEMFARLREPHGAMLVVFALLLSEDREVRGRQLGLLALDAADERELMRLWGQRMGLKAAQALALAELAVPALRGLTRGQYADFRRKAEGLIAADGRVNVFEFLLERIVLRHLDRRFLPQAGKEGVVFCSLEPLREEMGVVLAALALAGAEGDDGAAGRAFGAGLAVLGGGSGACGTLSAEGLRLPEGITVATLGRALERIAGGSGEVKRRFLQACQAVVSADARRTEWERHLLRAVAESIGLAGMVADELGAVGAG